MPDLILASAGFGSSSGIAQAKPIRVAPGMRPSLHRICMRRVEIPHLLAVCVTDKYFIAWPPACSVCIYNNSFYIIIASTNKIKWQSVKIINYFHLVFIGEWDYLNKQILPCVRTPAMLAILPNPIFTDASTPQINKAP